MNAINICPIESPCLDCQSRHFRCHSKCERYAGYRVKCDALAEERKSKYGITELEATRQYKIEKGRRFGK